MGLDAILAIRRLPLGQPWGDFADRPGEARQIGESERGRAP